MGLIKYRLGDLLQLLEAKNDNLQYGIDSVRGVNNLKKMMPTKADLNGRDLSKFQIVNPGEFFFNHRTSRNGSKFSITYNDEANPIICTEDYVVFKIKPDCENIILTDWLYMYFNRSEFDRYVITNSWGSSTEFYNWEDICAIEMELPSLTIQQRFVDVYRSLLTNQQSYERGLEDLKLVCDAYIERAKHGSIGGNWYYLGNLIEQRREKYDGSNIPIRGVSKEGFIEPKQQDVDLHLYNQYYLYDFVFNPARMEINSIALNTYYEKACCSSLYEVFYVSHHEIINSEYLNLLLKRSEFARWCQYVGWGSAREYCRVDTISEYRLFVPSYEKQTAIVEIYRAYEMRKNLCKKISDQIKDICPILIKGSIEEARRGA